MFSTLALIEICRKRLDLMKNRGKETQEAYLLHLHDHNCVKNSRHFLFTGFFFHFRPNLHRPHAKSSFSEWTVEYFIFNLLQVFAIDINIC